MAASVLVQQQKGMNSFSTSIMPEVLISWLDLGFGFHLCFSAVLGTKMWDTSQQSCRQRHAFSFQ